MTEKPEMRVVPCGSCHACCRQWVFVNPAAGDVPELYDTVAVVHPLTGETVKALAHKPDGGGCIYLGANGCVIHDRAPAACRAFDCRVYYLRMMTKPRSVRKREIRDQYSAKDLFERGRELQRTHPVAEPNGER